MNNKITTTSIVVVISIFVFASFCLPLLTAFSLINYPDYDQCKYIFVIAVYICLIITVIYNGDNLKNYNLDRGAILILVISGFTPKPLHITNENIYKPIVLGLSLLLFYLFFLKKEKLEKTNWHWIGLAFILGFLFVTLFSFFESQQHEKYAASAAIYKDGSRFFGYTIRNFGYQLSLVVPYEELAIRSLLWGQLREWKLSENKIFLIQGLLFWGLHIWQIGYLISFFIGIPIITFIVSSLAKRSGQISPSIIAHLTVNILMPIFVSFYP